MGPEIGYQKQNIEKLTSVDDVHCCRATELQSPRASVTVAVAGDTVVVVAVGVDAAAGVARAVVAAAAVESFAVVAVERAAAAGTNAPHSLLSSCAIDSEAPKCVDRPNAIRPDAAAGLRVANVGGHLVAGTIGCGTVCKKQKR